MESGKAKYIFPQMFLMMILIVTEIVQYHFMQCRTVVMRGYLSYVRVHKIIVILQSCINLLEVVPGSCSETCYDRNQVINIKVEEVADVQEEEVTVPITFPVIKAEHEVSCICVCIAIHILPISSIVYIVFLISTLGNGI
jgi:hypothetical protein